MAEPEDHSGFGTEVLSANGEDRPLVTFALFAYNQEDYIREAVEGAFAQTYNPLEIILSDDCSSDRTFEIMQEMAAAYQGPHRLVLRRNPQNLGLIDHCNTICEQVQSEFIVLAAGDDVSYPHRVAVSVGCLRGDPRAVLVHSSARRMDEHGNDLDVFVPPVTNNDAQAISLALEKSIYIGATAAFRSSFFHRFGWIEEKETYEDLIFGFRASLLGGLRYIDDVLIRYRVGVGLSFQSYTSRHKLRDNRLRRINSLIAVLKQRRVDSEKLKDSGLEAVRKALDDGLVKFSAKRDFYLDHRAFCKGLVSRNLPVYFVTLFSEGLFLVKGRL